MGNFYVPIVFQPRLLFAAVVGKESGLTTIQVTITLRFAKAAMKPITHIATIVTE